ncbi:MAG: MutS-related protein [Longimicrobiales bacterium]
MKLLSIPSTPGQAPVPRPPRQALNPDEMVMDRQTYRDLEIFEAEEAPTVFDLLNRTRTRGGAQALRTRWRHPLSNAHKIRTVQQSLQHVLEHRRAYDLLPGEVIVSSVEKFVQSGLSIVTSRNPIDLFMEAITARFGSDYRHYWDVMNGVNRSVRMIHALKRLAARPELAGAPGELGPLLQELRSLVQRPAFAALPPEGHGQLPFLRTIRVDRLVRLDERDAIERMLRIIFEIDAFISMADATRQFQFAMPEVVDGELEVVAEGVYHPFVENAVPNALQVDQQKRLLFLTGPNMAGKTTYLRASGIALYLAHLGMGVPAHSFRFSPCDSLFTAIALVDNLRSGISFFRAEALRIKSIAQAVADGQRVAALLDEPFMGTNVKDALDASRAVLVRLAAMNGCVFLVSSHLIELGEPLLATQGVTCFRFEANEQSGTLEFDYVLRPGISSQRLGMRVLREEGVFDLLASDRDPSV